MQFEAMEKVEIITERTDFGPLTCRHNALDTLERAWSVTADADPLRPVRDCLDLVQSLFSGRHFSGARVAVTPRVYQSPVFHVGEHVISANFPTDAGAIEVHFSGHGAEPRQGDQHGEDRAWVGRLATSLWRELSLRQMRLAEATLRRQLDQSRKVEGIGTLAARVSHDFNNVLTIINGYSAVLLDKFDPRSPAHDEISEIFRAGKHGADLVRQLLTFRVPHTYHAEVVDINGIVREAGAILKPVLQERTIVEVKTEHSSNWVLVDPVVCKQIIVNLAAVIACRLVPDDTFTIETSTCDPGPAYRREFRNMNAHSYAALRLSLDATAAVGTDSSASRHFYPATKQPEIQPDLAPVYKLINQTGSFIAVRTSGRHVEYVTYFANAMPEARNTPSGLTEAAAMPCTATDRGAAAAAGAAQTGTGRVVAIVSARPAITDELYTALESLGHIGFTMDRARVARKEIRQLAEIIDAVIVDRDIGDTDPDTFAGEVAKAHPDMSVIMLHDEDDLCSRRCDSPFSILELPLVRCTLESVLTAGATADNTGRNPV